MVCSAPRHAASLLIVVFFMILFGCVTSTTVGIYYQDRLTGSAGGPCDDEATNLISILQHFIETKPEFSDYVVDSSITTFGDPNLKSKLDSFSFFIMPEVETSSLKTVRGWGSTAIGILRAYVENGGTMILTSPMNSGDDFLNAIFPGWDVSEAGSCRKHQSRNTGNAAGTAFAGGPSKLDCPSTTKLFDCGSVECIPIYGPKNACIVALLPFGSGLVIFLSWDFYNTGYATSVPKGTHMNCPLRHNTWTTDIFPRALRLAASSSNHQAPPTQGQPGNTEPAPECTDSPQDWYDDWGEEYNCAWYENDNNCEQYGDSYENFGATASLACCVCGGGQVVTSNTVKVTNPPTPTPTNAPSQSPTTQPPTSRPTTRPTAEPTNEPTTNPTPLPTRNPTNAPTQYPTLLPTERPTDSPTVAPTKEPTSIPTSRPTKAPTLFPTASPTQSPTVTPTASPTETPTLDPTAAPTPLPTASPTVSPTDNPTLHPSQPPSSKPSKEPTSSPTPAPTSRPTSGPTLNPTLSPTTLPTRIPTTEPSHSLTTLNPTSQPTNSPTTTPTSVPTLNPSSGPTTLSPTSSPTTKPSPSPSPSPTEMPTSNPTSLTSMVPTRPVPALRRPTLTPTALPDVNDKVSATAESRGAGQMCSDDSDCASDTCRNGVCMASKDCYPLKHTYGKPIDDNSVKIVFVGSAFKNSTHEEWQAQVNTSFQMFGSYNMFSNDIESLNVFVVDPPKLSNSFCIFNCANIDRLLCCDVDQAKRLSDKCFTSGASVQTVVIHNDQRYGGAGYSVHNMATMTVHPQGPLVAIHELGHSLFELTDEYSYGPGTDLDPNCSLDRKCSKWSDLMGKGNTPKPYNRVKCVPGCRNGNFFVGELSYMEDLSKPVGAVNERFTCCTYLALTKSMPAYCKVFDKSPGYLLNYCKNNDYQKYGPTSYDLKPKAYIPSEARKNDDKYVYVSDPVSVKIKLHEGGKGNALLERRPVELPPGLFRKSQVLGDFTRKKKAARYGQDSVVTLRVFYKSGKEILYFSQNSTIDIPLLPIGGNASKTTNPRTLSERSNFLEVILDRNGRTINKVRPRIESTA